MIAVTLNGVCALALITAHAALPCYWISRNAVPPAPTFGQRVARHPMVKACSVRYAATLTRFRPVVFDV